MSKFSQYVAKWIEHTTILNYHSVVLSKETKTMKPLHFVGLGIIVILVVPLVITFVA